MSWCGDFGSHGRHSVEYPSVRLVGGPRTSHLPGCTKLSVSTKEVDRGIRDQKASQAHGEEEAPQVAQEDAHPASSRRQVTLRAVVTCGGINMAWLPSAAVNYGPSTPRAGGGGRVIIVTRQGCHLCDEVIGLVARLRQEHRDLVPEPMIVDVDANEDFRSRWGDHVPVIFVDGTLISYWTLDADTFLSALRDGPSLPAVLP
jgi:hypothetical protein